MYSRFVVDLPLVNVRKSEHRSSLLRFHIVAKQRVLVANVEFAIRNDRMRPSWFIRAFGLIEPDAFQVFLAAGFNQHNWAVLGAVIDPAIRERNGSFGDAALVAIRLVPEDGARLEVETGQITAAIAAVCSKQRPVVEDHAAMVILHGFGEPQFLRDELTGRVLA